MHLERSRWCFEPIKVIFVLRTESKIADEETPIQEDSGLLMLPSPRTFFLTDGAGWPAVDSSDSSTWL